LSTQNLPFDQNRLIDHLRQTLKADTDLELSRALDVAPPVISKIRHHRALVGATLKIRIMEKTEMTLDELHFLIGAPEA
jgi:hypothetical protein